MTFDVGLIGDTSYTSSQLAAFVKERDEKLNPAGLAFVTHDGDIKSGDSPCTDDVYLGMRDIFNGFTAPLVYTPGDSEWSDCSNQLDRLNFVRQTFFSTNETLGQHRFTVTRQARFPENARWTYGNVVFATLNTPGASNNISHPDEYGPRNEANLAWMRAAFDAGATARGVVIVTQANWGAPYNDTTRRGFDDLKHLLEDETVAYGRPVVLVHGDTHSFRIDHPMTHDGHVVENFTRIETYGPSSTHWVKLSIVADDRVFVAASH